MRAGVPSPLGDFTARCFPPIGLDPDGLGGRRPRFRRLYSHGAAVLVFDVFDAAVPPSDRGAVLAPLAFGKHAWRLPPASAGFAGNDDSLPRKNAIRISNLVPVRIVNDRIPLAVAVFGEANAP